MMLQKRRKLKLLNLFRSSRLGSARVTLHGEDTTGNLLTVLVDAAGNLVSVIKGDDGGTLRTVKVDSNARMEAVMKGLYGADFKTLATDTNGNLIAILKGASGNDIAVDANGYLTALIHGDKGAVAQDAANKLISVIQGSESLGIKQKTTTGELIASIQASEGIDVKQKASTGELISIIQGDKGTVAQDASNKLIAIMQGSKGVAITQDDAYNLIAVMKGDYAGALQTVKLDSEHRMIARTLTGVDDIVNELVADLVPLGDDGITIYGTACPAGKYQCIQNLDAYNATSHTVDIYIWKKVGGNDFIIKHAHDVPEDYHINWQGNIWLDVGEQIKVLFANTSALSVAHLTILGFQISKL